MTPEQLERFAKDMTYEVRMLDATARALLTTPLGLEHNAFLESLLIHASVLNEFLGGKQSRRDDVLASDYNPNWKQQEFMPKPAKKARHKLVAHASRVRLRKGKVDFHATASAVMTGFQQFVNKLGEPQRGWFAEAATVAGDYLGLPTPMNATTTTSTTTGSYYAVRGSLMDYFTPPTPGDS